MIGQKRTAAFFTLPGILVYMGCLVCLGCTGLDGMLHAGDVDGSTESTESADLKGFMPVSATIAERLLPLQLGVAELGRRRDWENALQTDEDCHMDDTLMDEAKEYGMGSGVEVIDLHRQGTAAAQTVTGLVQVRCMMGAYQGVYRYYTVLVQGDNNTPMTMAMAPLTLMQPIEADAGHQPTVAPAAEIAGWPDWHRDKQTLTVFSKYRGPGDCGFYGQYTYDAARRQFNTTVVRERDCSDTVPETINPAEWPQIYPAF